MRQSDDAVAPQRATTSIGLSIRRQRLQASKTQRDLAEETGIAISYLSRVENGRVNPSVGTLAKIAKALALPVTALLDAEPSGDSGKSCPVSMSGKCILEHGFVRRGRTIAGPEAYSSAHLKTLRDCNRLLHSGSQVAVDTLATVVTALLQMT